MSEQLPIFAVLPAIEAGFKGHNQLILNAPPGAGKTTVVPATLLGQCTGEILLIEPRRVAARNAAGALAERVGCGLGEVVGYAVRGDSKLSGRTRLKVVTPGVFLAMLQADPELAGVDAVILDEFHERQRDIDLACALTLDCQAGLREDLRLIIMSATLDQAELARALPDAVVVTSKGRQFPVEQRYSDESATEVIEQLLAEETGDILAFLPGRREIDSLHRQLAKANADVRPLHGGLTLKEQRAVLAPGPKRRIILATNIAESSLTVPGVRLVVDTGLERRVEFDLARGVDELVTRPISRASATQRAGRAGRLEPGLCVRLWREAAHGARPEQTLPEIARSDLTALALQTAVWGAQPEDLPFITPPPDPALARARDALGAEGLGLLGDTGRPTKLGNRCAALPLAPSAALLSLYDQPALAVALSEQAASQAQPDLRKALDRLTGEQRALVKRAKVPNPLAHLAPNEALARAHPHWIAQRQTRTDRDRAVYALAGGGQVLLMPGTSLEGADYLAVGSLHASEHLTLPLISAALPITLAELKQLFPERFVQKTSIRWSTQHQALQARQERRFAELVIDHNNIPPDKVDGGQRTGIVRQALARLGAEMFLSDDARRLLARLRFAQMASDAPPEPDWQSLDWLDGYLDRVVQKQDFKAVNWLAALEGTLSWEQRQWLDKRFPAALPIPSGRKATIDYSCDPPRISAKLQEFFGSRQTPSVNGERVALSIDLLSPNGHSLAITQDLPAFWSGAYREVAKEGRARYAKHPWPTDPENAEPTALTNRRLREKG